MVKFRFTSSLTAIAMVGVFAAGCSKSGSSSDSSSSGGSVSNISGKVSSTVSSSSLFKPARDDRGASLESFSESVSQDALSGCSMEAYDLTSNAVVGTATSDSSGNYTIKGVTAGETYKVVATCGTTVLSSVASASVSDPATITDDQRITTDPKSTIIAAMVVQQILTSVEDTLTAVLGSTSSGAALTLKNTLMTSLKKALQSSIDLITANINESINSGAMAVPTAADVATVGNTLKTATTATAANSAVSAVATVIPESVTQAAAGARNQTAAFMACNTELNSSQAGVATYAKCFVAVAKFFRNGLGFPLWLKTSGGQFGTISSCATTGTASGAAGATLESIFPNSKFQAGGAGGVPSGYCEVKSAFGTLDRNQGFEDGDSGDHYPRLAESGAIMGASASTGLLSSIAEGMYYGKKYVFADIDKIVFGSASMTSASTFSGGSLGSGDAGMNMRLVQKSFSGSDYLNAIYKYYSSGAWTASGWPTSAMCGFSQESGAAAKACNPRRINWGFTDAVWSSAVNDGGTTENENTVATAIGAGNVLTLKPFKNKFGGTVPSQAELDSFIDEERVALDRNPTGSREFTVLTTANTFNPDCFDNDPSTSCPATAVELTFAKQNIASGYKKITAFSTATTSNAAGNVYLRPLYDNNGFSGAFQLIRVEDGRIVRDEFQRERGVRVITTANTDCPPESGTCSAGALYNVVFDWSQCGQGSSNACPSVVYPANTGNTAITATGITAFTISTNWKARFMNFGGASQMTHNILGRGRWDNLEYAQFNGFSVTGSTDKILASAATYSNSVAGSGKYNLAVWYNCGDQACASPTLKFYFVDSTGAPYVDANAVSGNKLATSTDIGNTTLPANTMVFTAAELGTGSFYDTNALPDMGNDPANNAYGTVDPANVLAEKRVYTAPVANRNFKCEAQPYYIDVGGSTDLNCAATSTSGDNATTEASGDISFDNQFSVYDYFRRNPSTSYTLANVRQRKNGYAVADPVGTRNLLTTAFNGKFTGTFTMDESTKFDSIQAFALIYMMLSNSDAGFQAEIDTTAQNATYLPIELPSSEGVMNRGFGNGFYNYFQP